MNRIDEIIRAEIPINFFHDWLPCLDQAYTEAAIIVNKEFERPEAHNMLPHIYNSKVEEHLRRIAGKYPCFAIEEARAENGYNFLILRTASMIITQKSIQSPGSMVDTSSTRKVLALGNSLYCDNYSTPLFAIDPMASDKRSNRIYGILTHNRASVFVNEGEPFANMAFPDPNFKYYIENFDINGYCRTINRFKVIPTPIDEIKDEAIPKLKIEINKEGAK